MNLVILAAGQGKRMYSDLPKVLHPLAGRPLLAHVLDTARSLGPARVCVVYGHGGEQVREAIGDDAIAWVRQEPQLGTGHAVQQALPMLGADAPTLVLYGDVPLIARRDAARAGRRPPATALALAHRDARRPDRLRPHRARRRGAVKRIVEEKDATAAERAHARDQHRHHGPPDARPRALARGARQRQRAARVLPDRRDRGCGRRRRAGERGPARGRLGNARASTARRSWPNSSGVYQHELPRRLLAAGVTLADPARIDVRGEARHAGATSRSTSTACSRATWSLGDRVSLGAHCVLRNVRVGADTAHRAVLPPRGGGRSARNCRIGPYARLRPGTQLAEDVHVGNFVEVKASTIGAGSKANHLAYIGDARSAATSTSAPAPSPATTTARTSTAP